MVHSEYATTSTKRQLTSSAYAIHPHEARDGIYGPVPAREAKGVTLRRARGRLVTEGFIPSQVPHEGLCRSQDQICYQKNSGFSRHLLNLGTFPRSFVAKCGEFGTFSSKAVENWVISRKGQISYTGTFLSNFRHSLILRYVQNRQGWTKLCWKAFFVLWKCFESRHFPTKLRGKVPRFKKCRKKVPRIETFFLLSNLIVRPALGAGPVELA